MRQQKQVASAIHHCCGQWSPGLPWDNGWDLAITPPCTCVHVYMGLLHPHVLFPLTRITSSRHCTVQRTRSPGFVNRIIQAMWRLIVKWCIQRTPSETLYSILNSYILVGLVRLHGWCFEVTTTHSCFIAPSLRLLPAPCKWLSSLIIFTFK